MKTGTKSNNIHRKQTPEGFRNSKQQGGPTQKKKRDSFFLDVVDSEKKNHHQKHHGAGRNSDSPAGKRGPGGVQKTTSFKPKQQSRSNGRNNSDRLPSKKRTHNTTGPQKGHQRDQKRGAPAASKRADQLFMGTPGKVNYCLAPERLEAQTRAVKELAREEREKELEARKEKRNRQHKMMTQKTRKGQPVMQGRMELLLEKIKKSVGVQ